MKTVFDVLILGAGASGLMCAAELKANSNLHIGVIEGNAKAGAKLKISGGGKCNITNASVSENNFLGDENFVKQVLQGFGKEELLDFLHVNGVALELRKGRYYFCKKSSDAIIELLLKRCKGVAFFYSHAIKSLEHINNVYILHTDKGTFEAKHVVVATGGESYKSVGASDVGLKIASDFQLEVIPFTPALVGLTVQKEQFWMKELSGISTPVEIFVDSKTLQEELLFAHKGISGPAVLSASLYWKKGELCINFLPQAEIKNLLNNTKKLISSALPLPKRFMKRFLEHLNIDDKPCYR